ncbi:MAG: AI-2E family transporter, partial [Bradymonadaceae bacterium]
MTDDGSADSSSGSPSKQNKPTRSGDGEVNQRSVTSRWARLPAGLRRARRAFVPLFTMGFLVVVLVAFSSILLPFIFACMLVYLMEPLVSWMSQPKRGRRGLPRWASVVLVYIGFLTIVSTSLILVVPRFVTEIVRFAESSPEAVADFRKERLPGLNEQLHEFLSSYLPMDAEPLDIVPARDVVREARIKAVGVAAAMGGAQASVAAASQAEVQWDLQGEPGQLTRTYIGRVPEAALEAIPSPDAITSHGEWGVVKTEELPALKLHPDGRGGYEIYWNDDVLEVVARGEKGWIVRRHVEDE